MTGDMQNLQHSLHTIIDQLYQISSAKKEALSGGESQNNSPQVSKKTDELLNKLMDIMGKIFALELKQMMTAFQSLPQSKDVSQQPSSANSARSGISITPHSGEITTPKIQLTNGKALPKETFR